MSLPTKELQEVFKDAQQVTSLEAADRIGVIGENGVLKKTTLSTINGIQSNVQIQVKYGEWLRFAKYIYSTSPVALIILSHVWGSVAPAGTILVVNSNVSSDKNPINVSILSSSSTPSFNAIRCVAEGSNRYLEVRLAKVSTNYPIVRIIGVSIEQIPFSISTAADADVINTVSLIFGGGVNTNHSISYTNIPKGGGLRNEFGDEGFIQQLVEGEDGRCSFGERLLLGYGHLQDSWSLQCGSTTNCKYPSRCISLRYINGKLWRDIWKTRICYRPNSDRQRIQNIFSSLCQRNNRYQKFELGKACIRTVNLASERRAA